MEQKIYRAKWKVGEKYEKVIEQVVEVREWKLYKERKKGEEERVGKNRIYVWEFKCISKKFDK